jgi:hypothetical protein
MRISQDEILSIRKAIQTRDPLATVSLFGSMVDDQNWGQCAFSFKMALPESRGKGATAPS